MTQDIIRRKIVILTEGRTDPYWAKTAVGVIRYRGNEVLAVLDRNLKGKTTGEVLGVGGAIPIIGSLAEAPAADTLLIGIAPDRGAIPPEWRPILFDAIDRKMNIVSGLHDFLSDDPDFADLAKEQGVDLIDLRKSNEHFVARRKGINPDCLRIHTVANDCTVGKMFTSIELARALEQQGHDACFVATGQTGMMISGSGCAVDSMISDFVNGAAERLVLKNQRHQIIVVEGQGSLIHPMYSSVTLGLLHGVAPQGLIFCYEVGRKHSYHFPDFPFPPIKELIQLYETMASVMGPCKVIGIAMNSKNCTAEEAEREREKVQNELNLPVCDVVRHGTEPLVAAVLKLKADIMSHCAETRA